MSFPARMPSLIGASLALSIALVPTGAAHTNYLAHLVPDGVSSSTGSADFDGAFLGYQDHPDACGELEVMHLGLNPHYLECPPTNIAFWILHESAEPELMTRVPADAETMPFDLSWCDDLGERTFVIVETECYPEGEVGGPIVVEVTLPTATASWGSIKTIYR